MRLIDADALKTSLIETLEVLRKNPKMDNQEAHLIAGFSMLGKMIDNAKTVDAVSVVQCKDCKRNADNGGLYPNGRTQCPIQEHYALLQDGYCHLGECKEVQRNFNASNTLDALKEVSK